MELLIEEFNTFSHTKKEHFHDIFCSRFICQQEASEDNYHFEGTNKMIRQANGAENKKIQFIFMMFEDSLSFRRCVSLSLVCVCARFI